MSTLQPQQYQRLKPISGFNSLHVCQLAVKVDGETEHLFIAILNDEAVGQVIAKIQYWKACAVRMMFVKLNCRHMGIATRLMKAVEAFAIQEKATQLELCVLRGNIPARRFWIHRCKFIDDETREAEGPRQAEYVTMVKAL